MLHNLTHSHVRLSKILPDKDKLSYTAIEMCWPRWFSLDTTVRATLWIDDKGYWYQQSKLVITDYKWEIALPCDTVEDLVYYFNAYWLYIK